MAVSKAQQKAVNKYVKDNYDRILITVPKGRKDIIKSVADAHGESVNGYIQRAIDERMERDAATPPPTAPTGYPAGDIDVTTGGGQVP